MSFNEKLQYLRRENKLSQEDLASMLDVTRQSVSKWESGTTYPEMDKLIMLCKIFNCSLDDLTNDEITEINVTRKSGTPLNNFIDSFLSIITKTFQMFRSFTMKQSISCIVSLLILALVLLIFSIPFEMLKDGLYNIIRYIDNDRIVGFTAGFFNLIISIIFFCLYILTFIYIFKTVYLDKYEFIEKEIHIEELPKNETNEIKIIKSATPKENTIFNFLGTLTIGFIKILVAIFSLPIMFTLMMLFFILAICIYFIMDGIFFLGIFLGIIFAIIATIWLLEIISIFLFNRKASFKRLLITFITFIAGMGISFGIALLEITRIDYVDSVPPSTKIITEQKTFNMKDDLALNFEAFYYYHGPNIVYLEDETLKDQVNITIENYGYSEVELTEVNNYIDVSAYYKNEWSNFRNTMMEIKHNIKNHVLYNYEKLYDYKMTITSSKQNIEILKNNTEKLKNKIIQDERNTYCENYRVTMRTYEIEIDKLLNERDNLQNKIEELQEKITELEEYRERVKDFLKE